MYGHLISIILFSFSVVVIPVYIFILGGGNTQLDVAAGSRKFSDSVLNKTFQKLFSVLYNCGTGALVQQRPLVAAVAPSKVDSSAARRQLDLLEFLVDV